MAGSRPETQLVQGANAFIVVSGTAIQWFDAILFNVEDYEAFVQVSADNGGTPASGDVCNVYVAYTTGDTLGDSSNDFDTDKHAQWLMQLDTYSTNGEDPARKSVGLRTAATACKIGVQCPQAATRNITVRARMTTHRAQ